MKNRARNTSSVTTENTDDFINVMTGEAIYVSYHKSTPDTQDMYTVHNVVCQKGKKKSLVVHIRHHEELDSKTSFTIPSRHLGNIGETSPKVFRAA